ncbi:SCAN domain-containing protein, partial [Tanacetum coccineum]
MGGVIGRISPKGTIILASIDTSDISKTKEKVFAMLDDFVEKIGEEHVVQVVIDNAANYKAAGEMLMDKRKKLSHPQTGLGRNT